MADSKKITAYHYTNENAWREMRKGHNGWIVEDPKTGKWVDGETIRGLWPFRRFPWSAPDLPRKAHRGAIEALLEPEPISWKNNPEFPYVWKTLMCDVLRGKRLVLLEIQVEPEDEAFVVDWAHIERCLRPKEGLGRPPTHRAIHNYWKSRAPIARYVGSQKNYSLPLVTIHQPIPTERLGIVWEKNTGEISF